MASNKIPTTQDAPAQIKLLRARKHTYSLADALFLVQLAINVGLPTVGGAIALVWPEAKPCVAAFALAAIVLDPLLVDRYLKRLLKQAAVIAEQFDCAVLQLPWDKFTVGDTVDHEEIHTAAASYTARRDDTAIMGWYPREVGKVPLHIARVICQRTNLRYDSSLRRRYGTILVLASLGLAALFVVVGLAQDATITAWVLTMAPATPLLAWAAREYYRQIDAADALEALKKQADALLERALADACPPDDCQAMSREFQSAIYLRRVANPLLVPFLYRFMRPRLENEMHEGAAHLVARYERTRKGRS